MTNGARDFDLERALNSHAHPKDGVSTVAELRRALDSFPADAKVYATWESVVRPIAIYADGQTGSCVIDADGSHYRQPDDRSPRALDEALEPTVAEMRSVLLDFGRWMITREAPRGSTVPFVRVLTAVERVALRLARLYFSTTREGGVLSDVLEEMRVHIARGCYELGAASSVLLNAHGRSGPCVKFAEDLGRLVSEISRLRDALELAYDLNVPPPGPWCESRGPSGYSCTRKPGHALITTHKGTIDHCAGNGDGSIACTWLESEARR